MDKKGFLFTVTVFFVLMYILLSISVWVKGVETAERTYAEFYKESTVELAIEQITPAKLDNVTFMIMNRALARLNDHSINSPVKAEDDETENIRAALNQLLVNGSADAKYFEEGGIAAEQSSSLKAWASNLNASLLAIGVYVSDFEVSDFKVGQSDVDLVNYSFNISLKLRDFTGTSSVSRSYPIANEIDITGLVDPALARETKAATEEAGKKGLTVYRQFFFHKDYETPSDIKTIKISGPIEGGQGWLYGPLAVASDTGSAVVPSWKDIAGSDRRLYTLVGSYRDINVLRIENREAYESFAGYIMISAPLEIKSDCGTVEGKTLNPITYNDDCEAETGTPSTDRPFIVAPEFNPDTAPECPMFGEHGGKRKCVLFINKYSEEQVRDDPERKRSRTSESGLYNIEDIRDFVMCGYYTHSPDAPSYLQRLLNESYSRDSDEFGIETFVIGNYANNFAIYDMNSRIDRQLLDDTISAIKVRGLPGCKGGSCTGEPVTGIFAVSKRVAEDYGLEDIICDGSKARCD